MNSIKTFAASLVVFMFAVMPGGAALGMGSAPGFPQIKIEAPEARMSRVIVGSVSVFMKISNTGKAEDTLVGARVDVPSAIVEIHDTENGKMFRKEKLRIPPADAVELKPGGLHIMIFKMPEDIKEGSEFRLVLLFEKSGEKQVDVKLGGADTQMHMHH